VKAILRGVLLLGILGMSGTAQAEYVIYGYYYVPVQTYYVPAQTYSTGRIYYDAYTGRQTTKAVYDQQMKAYNDYYSGNRSSYYTKDNYGTSYGTTNNHGTSYNTINNYGNSHTTINNYGTGRTTVNDYGDSRTTVNRRGR